MKPRLLALLLFTLSPLAADADRGALDSLYAELDYKLGNSHIYRDHKESRLEALKREATRPGLPPERVWELHSMIWSEYRNYLSDSAIVYMNRGLDIANRMKDPHRVATVTIDQATLFSGLGMYKEALDKLASLDRDRLTGRQPVDYHMAMRNIYVGLMLHTQSPLERDCYRDLMASYRDSVLVTAPPDSGEWMQMTETRHREEGNLEAALAMNDRRMESAMPGTPAHALIAFHRSLIHRAMGRPDEEKKDLAMSAISDIQSSILDNASIPLLAARLMDDGDIDRAYRYVQYSLDNITAFNTRIRSSEIIGIQRIIDGAYQQRSELQKRTLHLLLIIISLMSVLLAAATLWLWHQMRRGMAMSRQLERNNVELKALNTRLGEMNGEFQNINLEVTEANAIKEEYITYFLGECSKYIAKMDSLRRLANKKLRERKFDELLAITRNDTKEDELREFHDNFDTMFVHLFPDFVEKFNSLLLPDEQIVLKKGEALNVELRIYALIRLGIDDSGKIADFLGYSVNTIYNYRTKVKNKARIARADFETTVKKIGTFTAPGTPPEN